MSELENPVPRPILLSFRSSQAFITAVVAYAVFTDQFLFAVIIPVAPFTLHERVHTPTNKVQYWIALLLGVYGVACLITSRELNLRLRVRDTL